MSEAVDELGTHLKKASSGGDQGRIRALESDVADARERAQNAERVLAGLAGRADEDLRAIQVSASLLFIVSEWVTDDGKTVPQRATSPE